MQEKLILLVVGFIFRNIISKGHNMSKKEFLEKLLKATLNKLSKGGLEQEYSQVGIA